jgi:hypothetical protein
MDSSSPSFGGYISVLAYHFALLTYFYVLNLQQNDFLVTRNSHYVAITYAGKMKG